jgi:hypothetical protein
MVRPLDPNQLIAIENVACRSRLVFKDRTSPADTSPPLCPTPQRPFLAQPCGLERCSKAAAIWDVPELV